MTASTRSRHKCSQISVCTKDVHSWSYEGQDACPPAKHTECENGSLCFDRKVSIKFIENRSAKGKSPIHGYKNKNTMVRFNSKSRNGLRGV